MQSFATIGNIFLGKQEWCTRFPVSEFLQDFLKVLSSWLNKYKMVAHGDNDVSSGKEKAENCYNIISTKEFTVFNKYYICKSE